MRRGIWIMQTCTAMQLPTSRLRIKKKSQICFDLYLWDSFLTYKMCNVYLRLMLFCTANWIPLTISGSSGTIANSVTPIKYWNTHKHTQSLSNRTADRSQTKMLRMFFSHSLWKAFLVPGRWKNCSAGAGCSPWEDQHNMPSRLWQLSALPEPSSGTSGQRDDLLRHSGRKKKWDGIFDPPSFSHLVY